MKVYCGECRYYRKEFGEYCAASPVYGDGNYLERKQLQHAAPSAKNRSNDCPDYKKSYWAKFLRALRDPPGLSELMH